MRSRNFAQRAAVVGGLALPALTLTAGLSVGTASAHEVTGAAQPAQVAAPAGQQVCPLTSDLGAASGYGEFSFGDANRGQAANDDNEGNVAYGGNATFTGDFYVGEYTGVHDAAVIGGNVNGEIIPLSGSTGIYGGTISQPTPGMTQGSPPFSFSATQSAITNASATYGQDTTTAGATVTAHTNQLYLTGTNPTLNVFDLSPGQFAAAEAIYINVPIGSVVLVNVPDTNLSTTVINDVQYWNGAAYEAGAEYNSAAVDQVRNSTLFNFPAATVVNFSSAALAGTFVAPKADVTFDDGQLDGNLVADRISGSFEGEADPAFVGCQTSTPPAATPEASTVIALPLAAAAVIGIVVLRNRRKARRSPVA